MNDNQNITKPQKVVIIGGGPAGLAASLYAARSNLSPVVLAGSPSGGQLMLTSEVENYPGIGSILGSELISKMRNHTKNFGTRIIDENVLKIDFMCNPFKIYLAESAINKHFNLIDTDCITSEIVLITTGAKAIWLGLESETRLRGRGVSACATCDGFFFRNKIVAVVGGGDAAMEEALTLANFVSKVYLIHRRDSFRASKIMQEKVIKNIKIEIIWNTEVTEVLGENKVEGLKLKSVKISDQLQSDKKNPISTDSNRFQPISTLKVDGLFVAIGNIPDTNLFKDQLEVDGKGYIITSGRFAEEFTRAELQKHNIVHKVYIEREKIDKIKQKFDLNYKYITSTPGVFAAGDCVDFEYRQAITAVGMGVAAALEIEKWLE